MLRNTLYTVITGSMSPLIEPGETVEIQRKTSYNLGDIILFKNMRHNIVHRIVQITADSYVTKGDSYWRVDPPISQSKIVGKVLVIHDRNMRVIDVGTKRIKVFSLLDTLLFQNTLLKLVFFRKLRYLVLKFLKRVLSFIR